VKKAEPLSTGDSPCTTGADGQTQDDDAWQSGHAWTLKSKGRVVNGADVHMRALIRRADMLTASGRGGGIVSVLLPTTAKAMRRLERDRAYQLARVRKRSGGERERARDLEVIARFLWEAIILKGPNLNSAWQVKRFLCWIVQSLKDRRSPLYAWACREAPLLVEKERSLRWWQERAAELKKCRVNHNAD
jgi:hypothetical protein